MGDVASLTKVAIELNGTSIMAASGSFTRGILASKFDCSPNGGAAPVPEVRGTLATMRVSKGPLTYTPSLSFALDTGDADSGSIGDFLAILFGTETPTYVSAALAKHKFTVNNTDQPPWLNLYSNKDAVAKQIVGFRPTTIKISIKANEPLCNVEVSGIAATESDLAGAQTVVFSDVVPITPQMVSALTVGGATVTDFEDVTITFTRAQEGFKGLSNSRTITKIVSGKEWSMEIEATGLNFANETERAKFKAVSSSSFVMTLTDPLNNYITFNASEIYYKSWEGPNIAANDLLKLSIAAFATGALTGIWVEIQNAYMKRYDTGATITA